jgi:hypothetical protein
MSQYLKRPILVEATQWFKNGDHPEDGDERFPTPRDPANPFVTVASNADGSAADPRYTGEFAGERLEGQVVRYYRHPGVPGSTRCGHCGRLMHDHGWIDRPPSGMTVCPGDWIITELDGGHYYPCHPDVFAATYEPVPAAADPYGEL